MAGGKKAPQNAPPEVWERQEGETAQAFQAFAAYRDMGAERSLAKVAQKVGKSKPLMERWSRRWQWVIRAEAWDDEMDRQVRRELEKGITGMRKTHADIAHAMLVKALRALQAIPAEEMTPRDISTMVDVAAKLERLSRGEVTERTEGKQTIAGKVQTESVRKLEAVDLDKLTDEELEQLYETVAKLAAE